MCTLDAASAGATGTLTGSAANAGNSGDRYGLVLALSASGGGTVYTPFTRKLVFVNDINVQF